MNANGRKAELLLKASEHFLRSRNFDNCRRYALQAQNADTTNSAAAAQILAVADVLSAAAEINNRPNWYAVLGLSPYSDDSKLTNTLFANLLLLLSPKKNKFHFAGDALALVRDAWAVLSDPLKKSQFDDELRVFESKSKKEGKREGGVETTMEGQCGSGHDSFWTICPYCYYVYQYPRVYEDCCLRCQNKNCGRGFHAVALPEAPPPAVVRSGQYFCLGFYPIGFEGGEGKGFSSWTPFGPTLKEPREEEKIAVPEGNNGFDGHSFVELSDDSDNLGGDEFGDINGEKVETEEVKKGEEWTKGCATNIYQTVVPTVGKPVMKRKKSVAKGRKKKMGKGVRVKKDEGVALDSDSSGEDDEDLGCGIDGGIEVGIGGNSGMGGVHFFKGEDDIFGDLPDGF